MNEELNPDQKRAAEFKNGIVQVIAIPGSGKTRTMMERIGILVKDGIAPESILGLTFTRNAADEIRHRLSDVLGSYAARVFLATIHSFCYTVLRMEGIVFQILSGKEQLRFFKKVMDRLKVKDVSIGTALREISLAKNNLIMVDEFSELYEDDPTMKKIARLYEAYDLEKSQKMLLDFDDLLVETYKLLRDNMPVREKYREIFRHLMVDEFQDTNPVQMEILKLLIGDNGDSSFWVCGDDAQSIYGFIGASVGNILNFKQVFPESEQVILSLNYRSTPQILHACQNLIRHNERQIPKVLKTDNPDGADVIVIESSSEETEAQNIIKEIVELMHVRGYHHRHFAVLYRANFQSRIIEEAFLQHKIPYQIQNGLGFYDRKEVKGLIDYMRVIQNPLSEQGDEALVRILNIPNRYIGRDFCDKLRQHSLEIRVHLYEGLKSMTVLPPYLRKNVREFINLMDPWIENAGNTQPAELLYQLRAALDYDRYITDEDIPSPDDLKIANLNQLQMSAARFNDIESFLQYTETFNDKAVSDNKKGVHLMTIHRAKGLEFPVVFVVGMVEGIMPSKRGNLEEERRIAFVGMSRAMHFLYLSYSLNYLGLPAQKSIFLNEALGKEKIEPIDDAA